MRLGLFQQGLHFAPTCGREADQALPFVVCRIDTLDPPGFLHAAHQFGHGGLFGQHDAGEFVDAQTVFARQAGYGLGWGRSVVLRPWPVLGEQHLRAC